METSVTFPGLPAIVPAARRLVRGVLSGTPRARDLELIACELITNSIRHTPAGVDGGEFTITLRAGNGWARVEVSDAATGEWHLREDVRLDDEYGRGLAIVTALADKLGHDATPDGQTLWAEVCWPAQEGDQELWPVTRASPACSATTGSGGRSRRSRVAANG